MSEQAQTFYSDLQHAAINGSGGNPSGGANYVPSLKWDVLQAENPQIKAWIYQSGTPINYPVVAAKDYGQYLDHLPDQTQNVAGTPFIDFNNAADFSDNLTVIYGNDSGTDAMFGSLRSYSSQDYFSQHPTIDVLTPQNHFVVDLKYGAKVSAGQWRQRAFAFSHNLPALLDFAQANTTFHSDKDYDDTVHWVAFVVTDAKNFDAAHYVVLGVLRPGQGS